MNRARNLVLVAVALGLVGVVGAASAQTKKVVRTAPMGGAGGQIMPGLLDVEAPPPLSPERLHRFAGVLELDAAQTKAAEALYEGYTNLVKRTQKKMREDLHRAQEDMQDGDHAAFEKMLTAALSDNAAKMNESRDQFLSDLRALLRPEQTENWDKLERLRLRDSVLPQGSLSGSNVDLLNIIDGLKLAPTERAPLGETLGLYEIDLDRALRSRQALTEAGTDEKGSRSFDGESLKKHLAQQRDIDAKVQGVNQRYARQLAELVPTDKRGIFDELVRQQSFRKVYKDGSVARKAKAAQNLPGLSAEQRQQLGQAVADYNKSLKSANDRWAAAIAAAEKAGRTPNSPMSMMGDKPDPALAEARKGRRDLDSALREQMNSILTPEQIASLPTNSPDGGGGRQMIMAVADESGGHGVFVSDLSDELDDDGPSFVGAGGGPVIITHEVHGGGGGGQDEHHVTITQPGTQPPPAKKP